MLDGGGVWRACWSDVENMQGTPEGVEDAGWLTRVAAFPIGIQPDKFSEALESPDVKSSISGLLTRYAGRKVTKLNSSLTQVQVVSQSIA